MGYLLCFFLFCWFTRAWCPQQVDATAVQTRIVIVIVLTGKILILLKNIFLSNVKMYASMKDGSRMQLEETIQILPVVQADSPNIKIPGSRGAVQHVQLTDPAGEAISATDLSVVGGVCACVILVLKYT